MPYHIDCSSRSRIYILTLYIYWNLINRQLKNFIKSVLSEIGLSGEDVSKVSEVILSLDIKGLPILSHALEGKRENEFLLAIFAELLSLRSDIQNFIECATQYLESHYEDLSLFEKGMYWHLSGFMRINSPDSDYLILRAMNQSIDYLAQSSHHLAQFYKSRVYNTLGQRSYSNGLLDEAIIDFEAALKLKETRQ